MNQKYSHLQFICIQLYIRVVYLKHLKKKYDMDDMDFGLHIVFIGYILLVILCVLYGRYEIYTDRKHFSGFIENYTYVLLLLLLVRAIFTHDIVDKSHPPAQIQIHWIPILVVKLKVW